MGPKLKVHGNELSKTLSALVAVENDWPYIQYRSRVWLVPLEHCSFHTVYMIACETVQYTKRPNSNESLRIVFGIIAADE